MDHPNYFFSALHLSYLFFSALYSSLKQLLIITTLYKNNVYQYEIKAISPVDIACSRRSDSGLWCEVREREKIRRKRWRDEGLTLYPTPPPHCFFFPAHISLHRPHDSNTLPPPVWRGLSYLAKTGVCQLVPNKQDMVYSVYIVLESFFTI